LVSHSHLEQMRSTIEKSLNLVHSENTEIHSAIITNSKAINESVANLNKFESFMNTLIRTNDNLLLSERFMLKIIRLKFELEACIKSLRNYIMILTEIVDRSSIGYPSHFLFSSEFLSRNLLMLNDKFSSVSTVFSSSESEKYFKLPLATSSYNQSHLTSILTIPMIDGDGSIFEEKDQRYHDGFVVLQNFQFTVKLTFDQYEECILDYKKTETVCFIRPCLIRNGVDANFKCFQVSSTDFLVSKTDFNIQSLCNGILKDEKMLDTSDYAHLKVPENCQVTSKYFTIKKIARFSPVAEQSSHLLALNKIYKIDDNRIVLESGAQHHELKSLSVPDRALIEQIKKHRESFQNKQDIMKIPDHFEPLSITGVSVGTVCIILTLIIAIIVCKHL